MTIRELRLSKDLSQARFAEMLGIDRSDLGKMENGKKKVSARLAAKVKDVFGAEIDTENSAREQPAAEKPAKKTAKPKMEIYIQSPYGGNITPEEVAGKLPEGTESCYVRVDQNLIWWVRWDGETGAVEIWD